MQLSISIRLSLGIALSVWALVIVHRTLAPRLPVAYRAGLGFLVLSAVALTLSAIVTVVGRGPDWVYLVAVTPLMAYVAVSTIFDAVKIGRSRAEPPSTSGPEGSDDQVAGVRRLFREALNAPLWWARSQGGSGSQRPVWMIMVFAIGFVSAILSFATSAGVADLLLAGACLAGIVGIDVWLVRERRRDAKAGMEST